MPISPTIIKHATVQVEQDIVGGFDGILTPDSSLDPAFSINLGGSDLEAADFVTVSNSLVVVPWVFACVHTGTFLEVPPTYIHFNLTGASFVNVTDADSEQWIFNRFVDYLGALHQIGITTSVRPALTVDEYLAWEGAQRG